MSKLICLCILVCLAVMVNFGQTSPSHRYVLVPDKYAQVMQRQLLTIVKNGWGEVVPGDLYHGHLVLGSSSTLKEPMTVDRLFEQSVAVLYHSDEQLSRWRGEDGKLPVNKRRPRSLIGFWNSQVISAALFFPDPAKNVHYEWYGSIHTDELAMELPQLFVPRSDYEVLGGDQKPCVVNMIIDIYYSSQRPRSIELNGKGYTLSMDCAAIR